MPVTHRAAPEVQRVADHLISEWHDHLTGVPLQCVFRSEASRTAGKDRWASIRKVTGLNAWLAGERSEEPDRSMLVVLEVAEDVWARLDDWQRVALVDHELCHVWAEVDDDGDLVVRLVGHDVEEFAAVIGRHGLWRPDVEHFAGVVQQQLEVD